VACSYQLFEGSRLSLVIELQNSETRSENDALVTILPSQDLKKEALIAQLKPCQRYDPASQKSLISLNKAV